MSGKTLSGELKEHIPFTIAGAASGLLLLYIFNELLFGYGHKVFLVFHPLHIILSAFATTTLYRLRAAKSSVLKVCIIGYVGAIGVATISDSVIPYCGERIMGISIPTHAHSHTGDQLCTNPEHTHNQHQNHQHTEEAADQSHSPQASGDSQTKPVRHQPGKPDIHIGFIEDWQTVNAAAFAGIILGFIFSAGKVPHIAHVLVSTWASTAHIMMNTASELTLLNYFGILIVLFLAVWLPCCLSDIVFPTIFSLKNVEHIGH